MESPASTDTEALELSRVGVQLSPASSSRAAKLKDTRKMGDLHLRKMRIRSLLHVA